jgi:hypothetical protein
MFSFSISHFVFKRQPAGFFFKKKYQMKASQNNKYDITKTRFEEK